MIEETPGIVFHRGEAFGYKFVCVDYPTHETLACYFFCPWPSRFNGISHKWKVLQIGGAGRQIWDYSGETLRAVEGDEGCASDGRFNWYLGFYISYDEEVIKPGQLWSNEPHPDFDYPVSILATRIISYADSRAESLFLAMTKRPMVRP